MMSAEEVRNLKYKTNREREEKELSEIQDKITKEIEKENGRDWIGINKISDTNLEILEKLGYRVQQNFDPKETQHCYTISWIK